jgi:hypothetical protein
MKTASLAAKFLRTAGKGLQMAQRMHLHNAYHMTESAREIVPSALGRGDLSHAMSHAKRAAHVAPAHSSHIAGHVR